jgi:hypothetical protein
MTLQIVAEPWIDESTFDEVEAIVIVGYEGILLGIAIAVARLEILVLVTNHREAFVYQWSTEKMHFSKRKMCVQAIGAHDAIRSFGEA